MHDNPFTLPKPEYVRDLNIVKQYAEQAAHYLSIETKRPYEECFEWVKANIKPDGLFPIKDPAVRYLDRTENGDRVEKTTTFLEYLGSSIRDEELIAPTFTTYLHPKVKKSILAIFIGVNVKARSVAKKAMFAAKMAGDMILHLFKKNEQNNRKLANNAVSGAHVSNSQPLFNPTSHSTLTSNCRTTSGYGNANNEKMLSGNRHYHSYLIVLNNIVSITKNTDYDRLDQTMKKFGLRDVSADEVMELIHFSSDLYWRDRVNMQKIRSLVFSLTPQQRNAFAYTGDLYHVMKFNPDMMRGFLGKLSSKVQNSTLEDPAAVIKKYREEYLILAMQIFPNEMRGKKMNDIVGTQLEKDIAATVVNIYNTLQEYSDFIKTFLVTTNVPASLAFFPDSVRRAALTSDTDSTIFTVQDWIFWYYGKDVGFDERTCGLAATMIFIAAESITHILARMSANFGIETERIHQVAMKNEFYFPVFAPTNVGKHYFASVMTQEGNIYNTPDIEIKGVHLKSSNVPKQITKKAEEMMEKIIFETMNKGKIRLMDYLKEVADIERGIRDSILRGESTYMRSAQIKTANSYKKDEATSPYQFYNMWQEVFAPKYGDAPAAPYSAIKVSLNLSTPSSVRRWIEQIPDKELGLRMQKWLANNNKSGAITQFLLPESNLQLHGMPKELVDILDMRRSIADISKIFYLVLEVLGYYASNSGNTHLCMDYY